MIVAACFLIQQEDPNKGLWYDDGARTGQREGKSEEEIKAALNAHVAEGMMNISIASTIKVRGTEAEVRIENIEANNKDQKVTLMLNGSNEVIYESKAIAPGYHIQHVTLDKMLEPGVHDATALFTGYDPTTHEDRGRVAATVKLLVG